MGHKTIINIILAIGTLAAIVYGVIVGREYLANKPTVEDAPPPAKLEFVREMDPQYEEFVKEECKLESVEEWTANFIKISQNGRSFQFRLYFVDTPESELDESSQPMLRAQTEYFGDPPLSDLLNHGKEADEFVRKTLTERPFRIITRFEPARGTKSLYAFVQVDTEDNVRKYLSAMLVRKGLASITAKPSHTPFGQNAYDFREHLVKERQKAIDDLSGIWADSRLAQKLEELRQKTRDEDKPDSEANENDAESTSSGEAPVQPANGD